MQSRFLIYFIFVLGITQIYSCTSDQYNKSVDDYLILIENTEKINLKTGKLADGWYEVADSDNNFRRIFSVNSQYFYINPRPVILPENFKSIEFVQNEYCENGIEIIFDRVGAENWELATQRNLGNSLFFILNDKIISAPVVNIKITNGISFICLDGLTEKELTGKKWLNFL